MALIYDVLFDSGTRVLSLLDKAGNVISSCEVPSKDVDDITKPLTFKATQDGSTVRLFRYGSPDGAFQTSRDGGNTWEDYPLGIITLNAGDEVSFRAKSDRSSVLGYNKYFYFVMTGKIEAWHNVMSMQRTNDFSTYNIVENSSFYLLFKDCTSLTKAPVLPATTLAPSCYYYMFKGCTSLTEAPALPATTLAPSCYYYMFSGCTSLTKAHELPATTLATNCYIGMFYGCTSLTKAPELPATTLADNCYDNMFVGCTSLTKAPELPATTLALSCYKCMFKDCSSLNEVRCEIPSSYSSYDIPTYASDWLYGVASTGTFYTNADANWPSGASGVPQNWRRVPERDPALDDPAKPLTFKATQDGSTVTLKKSDALSGSFQTSRDGGNTWTDYTIGASITINTGDEVSFRAKSDRSSVLGYDKYFYFVMTGKIEAWHNVMSMQRTNDFSTYNIVERDLFKYLFKGCKSLVKAPALPATTLRPGCYYGMFAGCTSLANAPALPATKIDSSCYEYMFYGCTSLTKAPALPATSLGMYCYRFMFKDCKSLVKAPALPATKLSPDCYASMFKGCTSLVNAPALPSTTLSESCYYQMFSGCTSLTKAPELPATTLTPSCYGSMFDGCRSLTKAPELPATTLAKSCYYNMFQGCSRLNEVHCYMPSTISAEDIPTYTVNGGGGTFPWLERVSSTGTFYTNADANWPSGASGIPKNWTRVNEGAPATSDITKPLTFRATQNGSTVKLSKNGSPEGASFQTSGDGGNTWSDYTLDTAITLNAGEEVSFRAKADREFEQSDSKYFQFNMTGKIEAWHNVMSLYRTNDFATYESVMKFAFYYLFKDCTSLTKAPRLPATTLAQSCYYRMFDGCTSLTRAPALPATSLAETCYKGMFIGCTSLTEVPILSATRLGIRCYWQMFSGCSSLNEVYCKIPSSYNTEYMSTCADSWLYNVSSTGTFYTNADANWSSGSVSGIPEGWTRVND